MKQFRSALQIKRLLKTVEVSPDPSSAIDSLLATAVDLAPMVDGIIVGESPTADPGISPLALASLLMRRGLDPIPRLNCRDRNRIALQSELLGLRANGISSLLLEEGEPLPGCKPVYDAHLPELVEMAAQLTGEHVDETFSIGTRAMLTERGPVPDTESLSALGLAGARFLVIEPSGDLNQLEKLAATLVSEKITWSYSVIASFKVPDDPDPGEVSQCAEQARKVSQLPGISGINLRMGHRADVARCILKDL